MTPRRRKVKAVLYIYTEQKDKLKKLAERRDEPISKLIRDAIDLFLQKNP